LSFTVAERLTATPADAVVGVTGPMTGFAKTMIGAKAAASIGKGE
jgi:hypothetical protein